MTVDVAAVVAALDVTALVVDIAAVVAHHRGGRCRRRAGCGNIQPWPPFDETANRHGFDLMVVRGGWLLGSDGIMTHEHPRAHNFKCDLRSNLALFESHQDPSKSRQLVLTLVFFSI